MSNALKKFKESFELWKQGHELFKKSQAVLSSGPSSFYHKRIEDYVTALFEKYAPFKVGDTVAIIKPPNTNNGWESSAHFLIKGNTGIVRDVDYYDNNFIADVEWHNQTWIDTEGLKHHVNDPHIFRMKEDEIMKINV